MHFDELVFQNRLARNGTIIEVGANKGSMTHHFAVWERNKVVAFEPFPPAFQELQASMEREHGGHIPDRVRLIQAAAGEFPGTATMRIPKSDGVVFDEWASLSKSFEGMSAIEYDEVPVQVMTIDGLGLSDVCNMKIDAEGFEIEVLHGARNTIQRCRPILSVECEERHREGSTWYIPGFMKALDYDGFWYDFKKHEFRPITALDRKTMQQAGPSPLDHDYGDFYIFLFFFLPRENHDLRLRLEEIAPFRP